VTGQERGSGQQAFVAHFDRFPEDRPRLTAVTLRCLAGTGHPAEDHADVVEAVAEWIEAREPDWIVRAADADRAVQLRRLVPAASVVDAAMAVAAERVAADVAGAIVEVLTSDIVDISALAAHVRVRMDVVTL
jgi:3',5'-cyclic AMP phosphodiesterase CpdA